MPRPHESFTLPTEVPEVPKEAQTEFWTLFYIQVNAGRASLDDASLDSLQEVVAANVGEPVDRAIVIRIVRNWMERATG